MNQRLRNNKEILRTFMQDRYTDERLAMLLAHAQSGKLMYAACCCFVGTLTANHALRSETNADLYGRVRESEYDNTVRHLLHARLLPDALTAERAYCGLGILEMGISGADGDELRRRLLIPMVRAEIRRRDRLKETARHSELVQVHA